MRQRTRIAVGDVFRQKGPQGRLVEVTRIQKRCDEAAPEAADRIYFRFLPAGRVTPSQSRSCFTRWAQAKLNPAEVAALAAQW